MNPHHCPRCQRFVGRPGHAGRRGDLLAMMQGKAPPSEPHCRGERTKAAKRSARRLDHLRGWLGAGVIAPRAVRLLGGGNG